MKNLWNLVISTWDRISLMTKKQRLILIGFTILPGASLILIFLLLGRQIIQKQMKAKTSKISGKINITEEDIYKDLNYNGMYKFVKKNK